MTKLFELIRFSKLMKDFAEVERVVLKRNKNQWENDAEHSFDLAMLGWYIADANKLKLKKDLIIKYALAHDLVEIYAGDTYRYASKKIKSTKARRERKALYKINKQFPEFKELIQAIRAYEAQKDKESRFVSALDKLIPTINIYLDNGRTWKKKKITIPMIVNYKAKDMRASPEIEKYFWELIKILKKNKTRLFG